MSGHSGPVPDSAWAADAAARLRGRVEMFNASRPGGLDRWTMDLEQYELMRSHILTMLDEEADDDGTVLLGDLVAAAQAAFGAHPAFPKGRLRNYCTYTKVDLEARCLIERVPGRSPQRVRRLNPTVDRTGPSTPRTAPAPAAAGGPQSGRRARATESSTSSRRAAGSTASTSLM